MVTKSCGVGNPSEISVPLVQTYILLIWESIITYILNSAFVLSPFFR